MDRNIPCSMCDELPHHSKFRHCIRHSLEGRRQQFVEFVDRTLLLHSGDTIDFLRLTFDYNIKYGYTSRICTWIRLILMSNIRVLELSFAQNIKFPLNDLKSNESGTFELSNGPYVSESLKILTLNFCKFKLANFKVFRSLRRIVLKQVLLLEGSIGDIVSKCPLLEDFHLFFCNIHRRYFLYEGDLQLKNLSIRRCTINTQFDIRVNFSAPRLLSLVIEEEKFRCFTINKVSHVNYVGLFIEPPFISDRGDALRAFLLDVRHVKSLELSSWCVQIMKSLCTSFFNLKHLRLHLVLTKQELPGISCLLSSCPYLETLALEVDFFNEQNWVFRTPVSLSFDEEQFWKSESLRFVSLLNFLKTVDIDGFVGGNFDIPLVEFLLEKSMVLECMTINCKSNNSGMSSEEYSHFIETTSKKVLHMQRASSQARVEFF
ncbi:hypothetical protein FRX31_027494 [Thalictrum thalictroides]|uniref:At1g61320/AtMIF1 LRR domain-containing protein n=1 Tax=Thalictrum thalictroides TaxID=46969 RepID=A0A7J6VCT6_THATH|nr:hypothetical protein FRX31_027494 [Thalictrum thalictroides]